METFFTTKWFVFVIIPALIMLARMADVTIGTVRIIVVAKGDKYLAPLLGFFEVLIWVLTIGLIMANLNNWLAYIFYALGFAIGNYIGILMEERLAMGNVIVHVITKTKAGDLIRILKARKYKITHFKAISNQGEVSIIYILVKRKNLQRLVNRVKKSHPKAFFSIEDVRYVSEGLMPLKHATVRRNRSNFIKVSRPGK
jgi:uncharacterized protein YebE (UPF0316 family)